MARQDFDQLDGLIKRLRSMGDVAREAAPEVARELDQQLRQQIAAGVGPDGKAWQATKDGRTALRGAGRNLRCMADGSRVVAQLNGPEARHSIGAVRGGIRRQILPTRNLPQAIVTAINRVLVRRMALQLGGEP